MSDSPTADDRAAVSKIMAALEAAWKAGDGPGYAAPMTPDADFVTIRAEHFQGREAIGAGHAGIFRTIYAGSVTTLTLDSMRLLHPDVALIHVKSHLEVPAGPLAGKYDALFSAVLTRHDGGWQIASFHNTLAPQARN